MNDWCWPVTSYYILLFKDVSLCLVQLGNTGDGDVQAECGVHIAASFMFVGVCSKQGHVTECVHKLFGESSEECAVPDLFFVQRDFDTILVKFAFNWR